MRAGRSGPKDSIHDSEESTLVAAVQDGDLTAFERLIRDHGRSLMAVARRMLRNDDEAREAVQEAFVAAFRSCRQFEGGSRFATWLHRIVINTCLMRLRKQRRHLEVSIDELLPTFLADGHHAETFTDWSCAADTLVQQRETCELVRRCIDRLPDSYRTILLMRDIEGLPADAVATAVGLSTNAVHIRLHRARQALRTLLDRAFVRGPSL